MRFCQSGDVHGLFVACNINRGGVMSLTQLSDAELDDVVLRVSKEEAVLLQPFQKVNAVFAVK